uniref:reverse transcriptase domain-containing protein n=1 Tax=Microseira wollei TaxID=467598 RepID=UPI0035A23FA0
MGEITQKGRATKWFIEGDICGCFDRIEHTILLNILQDKIHDNRFSRIIKALLDAGDLENWKYNATYSGVPQGAVQRRNTFQFGARQAGQICRTQTNTSIHTRSTEKCLSTVQRIDPSCVKSTKSWKIGRSTATEPTGTVYSILRPQGPRLSSPLVHKVRR